MLKKMPFLLLLIIVLVFFCGEFIPLEIKQALYAISITIKSIIVNLLPIIIFGLIFRAAVLMAKKATWIVGILLTGTCISTFIALYLARFVGVAIYRAPLSMALPEKTEELVGLWDGSFNIWQTLINNPTPNNWVMLGAVILGLVGAFTKPELANQLSLRGEKFVTFILSFIGYVIPPFVAGFVIKLQHEGSIEMVAKNYLLIFLAIILSQFIYLFGIFFIAAKGSISIWLNNITNLVPSMISGFTTMSSAASLPLLIQGIEANTKHKQLARIVAPSLVNIHWVGECFVDVILAYAVLKTYGVAEPSFMSFVAFSLAFFGARFACVAIPGGGIIVVSPMLVQYFGFNGDMLSLITAIYMLADPVLTVGNLLGDGAISQLIDKLVTRYPSLVYSKAEIEKLNHNKI